MSSTTVPHSHDHAHDHAHDHPHGWRRWLFATNHKDIGSLYLWFSFTMLLSGGVLALLIRAELFQPGLQVVQPELFNQLTTMHGLIMVFGAIMPAFVGFANWMIPLQIGASDMAFARMNNFSFWLMPPAAILLVSSFFVPGGATAAGWTLYAPQMPAPRFARGCDRRMPARTLRLGEKSLIRKFASSQNTALIRFCASCLLRSKRLFSKPMATPVGSAYLRRSAMAHSPLLKSFITLVRILPILQNFPYRIRFANF